MTQPSEALPGLKVHLDSLVHHYDPENLPPERPHGFIYFITILNLSDRTVTFLGRKWIIRRPGGKMEVIEGDKIVGQTPTLEPGERWSYNSYHITDTSCKATGSFHGIDDAGNPVYVSIPEFEMVIPEEATDASTPGFPDTP